jgi:salicylate hydroxylase
VLGEPVKAVATGDAAYRAVIPTEKMMNDPELRALVENPEMTGWMGPNKHIMAYCIVSCDSNACDGVPS